MSKPGRSEGGRDVESRSGAGGSTSGAGGSTSGAGGSTSGAGGSRSGAGGSTSGEEYNPGPATRPRQAATVIVLRGGTEALEVLLVRRTPKARFMGGVWVFPGGAVDEDDIPGRPQGEAAQDEEILARAGI